MGSTAALTGLQQDRGIHAVAASEGAEATASIVTGVLVLGTVVLLAAVAGRRAWAHREVEANEIEHRDERQQPINLGDFDVGDTTVVDKEAAELEWDSQLYECTDPSPS